LAHDKANASANTQVKVLTDLVKSLLRVMDSIFYPSHQGGSKPRTLPSNNFTNWQSSAATGQDMVRDPSNGSAYYSAVSQQSDET